MSWIEKLVEMGQKLLGTDLKNPDVLKKEHIDAIGKYCAVTADVDQELGGRLVHYIVDGVGEEVLLQLVESGTQRLRDSTRQRCREIADRLGACGLIKLGEEIGLIAGDAPISDKLLRAE